MKIKCSKLFVLSLASLFASISCTTEKTEDLGPLNSTEESLITSGVSCGSAVNFSDLYVETSWISGEPGDRDQYLACGVDGEEWMDKYDDGRVQLTCLAEDSQRTELKEDNGVESSLRVYKKMQFTAVYSNLPNHGVTIAQIHNRADDVTRPWLRVYIDHDRRIKIKETLTTPDEDDSEYDTHDGIQYDNNGEVEITVWTGIDGDEAAVIRVDYNGDSFEEELAPTSDWNAFENDYYLKAGVYTEGEDREVRVTYSNFSIEY